MRLEKYRSAFYWPLIDFMKHWTWTQKILELLYWTRIDFMIGAGLEKYLDYLGFRLIL